MQSVASLKWGLRNVKEGVIKWLYSKISWQVRFS